MYNALMVKRLDSTLLLRPGDFSPTGAGLKVIGVFNPGAARVGDDIVLLVRVAEGCTDAEDGYLFSPRAVVKDGTPGYEIDRLEIHPDSGAKDHRKPLLIDGRRRLAFVSHLEMVRLAPDGRTVKGITRHLQLLPGTPLEEFGVEDPRITRIGDTYFITYVTVSGRMGVCTSLMFTKDFQAFERRGIMFPCENKDVVLFPEKVDGEYFAFHRPVGRIGISDLAIVGASSPDMVHWGNHELVLGCAREPGWYHARIGAGTPPIRTEKGWLSIFHGVAKTSPDDPIGEYTAGALLTALDEPTRLLAASKQPFFRAEADYELTGYVNSVVFPTGMVRDLNDEDKVLVYYGCADSCIAVCVFSVSDILSSL